MHKNNTNIIKLLDKALKDFDEFKTKYQGPGWKMRLKRFLRYKTHYINYILQRFGIIKPKLDYYYLLRLGPGPELKVIQYLLSIIKPNDIFYDIGSNYGLFIEVTKEIAKEIHAFEPLPKCFAYLQKNYGKYSNIFLNNLALGDKINEVEFYQSKDENTSGASTLIKEVAYRNIKKIKPIKVKMITLDEYIKSHNPPTIMKIDVEGAESFIIDGAKNLFKDYNPIIIMEVWSGKNGLDFSIKAVDKLLNYGYKCYLFENQELKEYYREKIIEWIKNSKLSNENFIFLK